MATRKPDHPKHDDRLPGEAGIGRVYRAGGGDMPPAALDARILDQARAAVQSPRTRATRWALPLSTAAVVVLAVGVVLLMTKEGALNHRTGMEVPNEYSVTPATPNSVGEDRAVTAPAEVMKKAEMPAVAPAPLALKSTPEAKRLDIAREQKPEALTRATGVSTMTTPTAEVTAVQASGSPGAYEFNVTVKSPDTGCQQYADWWEVVSADGRLLYRRVLLHSHVDEQPFTRSGGPVPIHAETIVWVRAHMNTVGYGGMAFKGSVKAGFAKSEPPANFAPALVKQPPLPDGCDF